MPLKIVIDVRRIRDFGIGTYIRSLVHALGVIDQTNHYILVSHPDDSRTFPGLAKNFDVALYARDDHSWWDHAAFPAFLRHLAPDLVHIPLNRVPLLMPKPYVVTIHDMATLLFAEHSGIRSQLRAYRFGRGLTRADKVIAVSAATRRDVQNMYGVPADRVRLVYNAPNPEFFRAANEPETPAQVQERNRIMERYQIQYPYLLYAGNIRPQKNIPRLVEAFAVARQQLQSHPVYKDLRLIIIGDLISRYPDVRRAVIQSRVEHCVRFLGFVPFDTLRSFYECAKAFVFPSLYEGFGLPPLEAMATGTPVITSGVSSLPEVVGDAAALVNPENVFDISKAICEVLLDEKLRERLITKGREHASRFSWERTAREVLMVYEEVGHAKR